MVINGLLLVIAGQPGGRYAAHLASITVSRKGPIRINIYPGNQQQGGKAFVPAGIAQAELFAGNGNSRMAIPMARRM